MSIITCKEYGCLASLTEKIIGLESPKQNLLVSRSGRPVAVHTTQESDELCIVLPSNARIYIARGREGLRSAFIPDSDGAVLYTDKTIRTNFLIRYQGTNTNITHIYIDEEQHIVSTLREYELDALLELPSGIQYTGFTKVLKDANDFRELTMFYSASAGYSYDETQWGSISDLIASGHATS